MPESKIMGGFSGWRGLRLGGGCRETLDGRVISTVKFKSVPIYPIILSNYQEHIQFYMFSSPQNPVVLGHPWPSLAPPTPNYVTDQSVWLSTANVKLMTKSRNLTIQKIHWTLCHC